MKLIIKEDFFKESVSYEDRNKEGKVIFRIKCE